MILFALSESWRMFRNLGLLGFFTILFLSFTLSAGIIYLISLRLVASWTQGRLSELETEVFLHQSTDSLGASHLVEEISRLPQVSSVKLITPEIARQRFSELYSGEIFDLLTDNPLPFSIIVTLKTDGEQHHPPRKMWEHFVQTVKLFPGVEEVIYQGELIAEVERVLSEGKKLLQILALGLGLIAVVLSYLTFRGTIRSRREFVKTVILSGGTMTMVKSPFLLLSCYYGLSASTLSLLFTLGLLKSLTWGWDIPLIFNIEDVLFSLLGGLLLSVFTSWIALSHVKWGK